MDKDKVQRTKNIEQREKNMTLIILILVLLSILMVPLSLKRLIDQKKTGRESVLPGFDMSEENEHRVILESRAGYGIEVDEAMPDGDDDPDRIIIAMHGFCGSKASRCISLLQRIVTGRGTGLVKFDWPAHGRSRAKDSDLTVTNCLSDLDTVVRHVREKYPHAKLITFATSFGGYITMVYNGKYPETFEQIILRSPALRFGWLLNERIIDDEMRKQLEEKGGFTTGFDRKICVSAELVKEAGENRIEDLYEEDQKLDDLTIIHGDSDELVPYEDSVAFAEKHGAELYTVHGADHRYTGEGLLEEAVAFAVRKIDEQSDEDTVQAL